MIKTRVCEIFGIQHPIVQGALQGLSYAELAAAVSSAGGLGMISGVLSPEKLRQEIRKAKSLTRKPFGVNIPIMLMHDRAREIIDVVIEEKVAVVATAAGSPEAFTKYLKTAKLTVMHVVSSVKHAQKAEAAGVDAVVVSGIESGGFLSYDELTTFVLIPQVVDCINVPVIAAGGIADARGMIAAFALGAEGIQMGTRFIATLECPANPDFKEAIVKATDIATEIKNRGQQPSRGFKPSFLKEVLPSTSASHSAGQIAGMITDIIPVKEVIDRLIVEADLVYDRIGKKLMR
jgi:NAD(P)H-dependent flavin oxidoreductase YrpB (nitropropane dioxygenase family)